MITKRIAAPDFLPLRKKEKKFTITPMPGPHRKAECIPLGIILRDMLCHAESISEAKKILMSGTVRINGKIIKDYRFAVGLMDVLSVTNDHFRVVPGKNRLHLKKISDSSIMLFEIKNKTAMRGRKTQLNLHNGSNIIAKDGDYKTGDVIVYDTERNEIAKKLEMKEGAMVVITSGRNIGKTGSLKKIVITEGSQRNYAVVSIEGKSTLVPKDYIFVVGSEKPEAEI